MLARAPLLTIAVGQPICGVIHETVVGEGATLSGLEATQAVGGSLYLFTSAAVGIRLLGLARRNRTLPELLLGIGFITAATIGSVIEAIAVVSAEQLAVEQVGRLLFVAKVSALFGMSAHVLFTWRVFRPDTTWAAVLAFSLIAIARSSGPIGFEPATYWLGWSR